MEFRVNDIVRIRYGERQSAKCRELAEVTRWGRGMIDRIYKGFAFVDFPATPFRSLEIPLSDLKLISHDGEWDAPEPDGEEDKSTICVESGSGSPYKERQAEWLEREGLSIGDYVWVHRSPTGEEAAFDAGLCCDDKLVGQCVRIIGILDDGILVRNEYSMSLSLLPYTVLGKSMPEYLPFDLSKREDRDALRDRWVMDLDGNEYMISAIHRRDRDGRWCVHLTKKGAVNSEGLLIGYRFLDGSHCGRPFSRTFPAACEMTVGAADEI